MGISFSHQLNSSLFHSLYIVGGVDTMYVSVIWMFLLIIHLYLIGVWSSEDQDQIPYRYMFKTIRMSIHGRGKYQIIRMQSL